MRALVVGGGSIGLRHLKNLKALGLDELGLVEIDKARSQALGNELGVSQFAKLSEGLKWAPDFVVIASPTHLHIEQGLDVVRQGRHVFIEKPLAHSPENLTELCRVAVSKRLISMVGCNMRFHPGPSKVKELIERNSCGKIWFARIHAGSYLPDWRPNTDYRDNYAAKEETGGGCMLDCIHEIDLARWYLGDALSVFSAAEHVSSLEIATEDYSTLVCRHQSGAFSEIHLDYLQRIYQRGCHISGELGSIFWDFTDQQVRWYNAASKTWTNFAQPEDWQLNQMYVDEMRHFIDCVRSGRPTMFPISEAALVMKIVFAAKLSAREGRRISITEGLPA